MSPRAPHRFYFPGHIDPLHPPASLELPASESHHLLRVLRVKPGSQVDLFDASGGAWSGEVMPPEPGSDRARIRLVYELPLEPADTAAVNMAVSVLKRRAMDLLLEKLSELGVDTLQPLICARTVAHPDAPPDAETPERWDRLVVAAAKQSGRTRPLVTTPPTKLMDWLGRARPPAHSAFAHFGVDAQPIGAWLREREGSNVPLWVVIGPEGGWTPDEVDAFILAGFTPVSLGRLTLRAETAAIAAAAACQLI